MTTLSGLPDDLCRQVALFLSAPDVLKLLTVNHRLAAVGQTEFLWRSLLARDSFSLEETSVVESHKNAYLTYAHVSDLSSVRWRPVHRTGQPSAREGGQQQQQQRWFAHQPTGRLSFVYGATLTVLDTMRAVRFGGFQAGGYSAETNQVAVLTLTETQHGQYVANWELIVTSGTPAAGRAYHSASLVRDRYLIIIGGMTSTRSVLDEAILDTHTWTWIDGDFTVSAPFVTRPSGRHGHSVVWDETRNRLVLFGGGSGSDLLHSGEDNAEVWELVSRDEGTCWIWNQLYRGVDEANGMALAPYSELSPAECLVLGRCHVGVKLVRDTVLLAFGSGRPTTNAVLAFDLATNRFFRPTVSSPLPVPRFSCAAAVHDGWFIAHGGYTTQVGGSRGDTVVLDLAPDMNRTFPALRAIRDEGLAMSYREIVDADIQPARSSRLEHELDRMVAQLPATSRENHRDVTVRMLSGLLANGGMGEGAALILSMVANGSAVVGGDDDDDSFEEEDDDAMSSNL